jgi:hypothetical protein
MNQEINALSGDLRGQDLEISRFWADLYRILGDSDIAVSVGGHLRSSRIYPPGHIFTVYDFNKLICIQDLLQTIETPGWKIRRFFEEAMDALP